MSSSSPVELRLADALAPRLDATMLGKIDELYETIGQLIVELRSRDRVIERLRRELDIVDDRTTVVNSSIRT